MNEEEIRGNLLLPFLDDLGFDVSEIKLEYSFTIRLGKSQHTIKGRSDILCKGNGRNLFIIELKNDSISITQNDIDQGISYARLMLTEVINQNRVCMKPLLDYHSNVIIAVLNLFLELDDSETAKEYLKAVIQNVIKRNTYNNFLPDANNSIENVIKFRMTGTKPVFYSDSTSPLLSMLFIYVVSRQAQPDKHLVLELSH